MSLCPRNPGEKKKSSLSLSLSGFPSYALWISNLSSAGLSWTDGWSQQQCLPRHQIFCLKSVKKKSSCSPGAIYILHLLLSLWKCLNYTNKLHPYSPPLNIKKVFCSFIQGFCCLLLFFFFKFRNRMQRNNNVQLCISAALPKLLYYKHTSFSSLHKICLIMGVYKILYISPSRLLVVFFSGKHKYKQKSLMQEYIKPLTLSSIGNTAPGR